MGVNSANWLQLYHKFTNCDFLLFQHALLAAPTDSSWRGFNLISWLQSNINMRNYNVNAFNLSTKNDNRRMTNDDVVLFSESYTQI